MPVVDRRVDRLATLKLAIVQASSPEESAAFQREFETICVEHRATLMQISELTALPWQLPKAFPSLRFAAAL